MSKAIQLRSRAASVEASKLLRQSRSTRRLSSAPWSSDSGVIRENGNPFTPHTVRNAVFTTVSYMYICTHDAHRLACSAHTEPRSAGRDRMAHTTQEQRRRHDASQRATRDDGGWTGNDTGRDARDTGDAPPPDRSPHDIPIRTLQGRFLRPLRTHTPIDSYSICTRLASCHDATNRTDLIT